MLVRRAYVHCVVACAVLVAAGPRRSPAGPDGGKPEAPAPPDPLPGAFRALRAARDVTKSHPDRAGEQLQLGRAYETLSQQAERPKFGDRMPLLARLRAAQAAAALRRAVRLDPDLAEAHLLLSNAFRRAGYADLGLKHLGEYVRSARRAGRRPGETEDQFGDRLRAAEKEQAELERRVKEDQRKYDAGATGKRVLDRARLALSLGLADKALRVLLDSDALEFGRQGALLELDLLLLTGDVEGLRVQIAPEDGKEREVVAEGVEKALGAGVYEQYRFFLAAAEGDAKEADAFLEKAQAKVTNDPERLRRARVELGLEGKDPGPAKDRNLRELLAVGAARLVADRTPQPAPAAWLLVRRLDQTSQEKRLRDLAAPLAFACDCETLRGLMWLETGEAARAEGHFRKALFGDESGKGREADAVIDFPGRAVAFRYLGVAEGLKQPKP
jgi:hypothetical protein